MSKRKPLIGSILDGGRQGQDRTAPAQDEAADDVRLLKEISLQVEREKIFGSFDATRPGEHVHRPTVDSDDVHEGRKKRPAPRYNKLLKEAERAALQKPLTPKKYQQLVKEHLEILPLVRKTMDKKATR